MRHGRPPVRRAVSAVRDANRAFLCRAFLTEEMDEVLRTSQPSRLPSACVRTMGTRTIQAGSPQSVGATKRLRLVSPPCSAGRHLQNNTKICSTSEAHFSTDARWHDFDERTSVGAQTCPTGGLRTCPSRLRRCCCCARHLSRDPSRSRTWVDLSARLSRRVNASHAAALRKDQRTVCERAASATDHPIFALPRRVQHRHTNSLPEPRSAALMARSSLN